MRENIILKWLKGGDRNSTFFHLLLQRLKAQNHLNYLEINEEITHNPQMIASHILGYNENIFSTKVGDAMELTLIELVMPFLVTSMNNGYLRSIPLLESINAIVFDIDPLCAQVNYFMSARILLV